MTDRKGTLDWGIAQLNLVEAALCPVSASSSRAHSAEYLYTDKAGKRRTANTRIVCPDGLRPTDEFVLWGLLAVTFAQETPSPTLMATPHYCLRQLQMIDGGNRGGKNYDLFRQSLMRLSSVSYQNDGFYDPIRGEHCAVSFGFLSYRLPLQDFDSYGGSSRAWKICWDPVFFEFCAAVKGRFYFDIELYRSFNPATRRLFLFLQKIFWRRGITHYIDVRHLAVDVLGYSSSLQQRDLNRRVRTCAESLLEKSVIRLPLDCKHISDIVERRSTGNYVVQFHKGRYFGQKRPKSPVTRKTTLTEPLMSIGLKPQLIWRLSQEYDHRLLHEWADITLARIERGLSFRKSPQAYFMDSIRNARDHGRTAPDWYHEVQRHEERQGDERFLNLVRQQLGHDDSSRKNETRSTEPVAVKDLLRSKI